MPLRLVFMGTPDFAVPTLAAIAKAGHEIAAVYTPAPKPAGRGMAVSSSPVEQAARGLGLTMLTPKSLRTPEAETTMRMHGADAAVVVAYGLILPKPILDVFHLGAFNVHASLLPRWRGAAPINRAIMAGDSESGITVMKMDEGLDTGPTVLRSRIPIGADMTAGELHDALAPLGADLMVQALAEIEHGAFELTPQPQAGVAYAAKIGNDETRIDWTRPRKTVHDHIRGLSPYPGAWSEIVVDGKPLRVKVLRSTEGSGSGEPGSVLDDQLTVACGDGAVRLLELQRAGRKPMKTDEFLRGTLVAARARFV